MYVIQDGGTILPHCGPTNYRIRSHLPLVVNKAPDLVGSSLDTVPLFLQVAVYFFTILLVNVFCFTDRGH